MFKKESFFLLKSKCLGRILTGLVLALAIVTTGSSAQAAITITNQSGSVVYTDFGNGYNAIYLIFQVTSDAVVADAWVELDTGGGNILNVGTGVHQFRYKPDVGVGDVDPTYEEGLYAGEPKGAFFLVKASSLAGSAQTLTVNVYDGDPGGGGSLIGTDTFGFTVEDTIQANANKVITVVTIPENPAAGELGNIVVSGCTGNIGATRLLYFSPVSADTWPADTFEFIDSDINITDYPNNPYKNMALIPTADVIDANKCYTDKFTFVINGEGTGTTTPSNFINSGNVNMKHTVNDSGSFSVIVPPAECSTITVSPSSLSDGTIGSVYGPVSFSAVAVPPEGYGDYDFTSTSLPAGMTLSPGGELSGTPTEGGTFSFTITATDTLNEDPVDCTGQITLNLTIICPTITVTPTSLADGTINVAYGPVQFEASGGSGPYEYEVTSGVLPTGMEFSIGGKLDGTPTEIGIFIFEVGLVDSSTNCTKREPLSLMLAINPPSNSIPTLSEWGMIIFSMLLAGSAIWMMRRRRNDI